jgi:aspartate/methionine/tyrosine aminotransferase
MKIQPFELERYFAAHEFTAPYLLSCSDCEPLLQEELLSMADADAMALWKELRLAYTDSQGHHTLREEIGRLYESISPDDVLILTPEEGIFIAMNVLLDPGDHVITTFPGYQSLYEVARSLGCAVSRWTPDEQYRFDIDALFEQVTDHTRLLVINFPHNPTGALIEPDQFTAILDYARQRDLWVFSDEMYRFMEYPPGQRLPSACDRYDKGLSLFGVSKSLALPGLRIGWLTTRDPGLMQSLCAFKDYTSICSSAPSEILAIIGLRNRDEILRRNMEIIWKNLHALEEFCMAHSGFFQYIPPRGGSVAFPKWLGSVPVGKLCQRLVNEAGIMLLPSTVYGYDVPAVRFGLGRKDLPVGLEKLGDYMKKSMY